MPVSLYLLQRLTATSLKHYCSVWWHRNQEANHLPNVARQHRKQAIKATTASFTRTSQLVSHTQRKIPTALQHLSLSTTLAAAIALSGRKIRGKAYMAPITSLHRTPSTVFKVSVVIRAFSASSPSTELFSYRQAQHQLHFNTDHHWTSVLLSCRSP